MKFCSRLIFTLLLLSSIATVAQNAIIETKIDDSNLTIQQIEEEHLEKYKSDKDFDYTETQEIDNNSSKFFNWLAGVLQRFFESIFGVGKAGGILYFIFNILPYVILGILLFLLIRFFLKVNSRNIVTTQKNASLINFSDEEQIIKNENINELILEAIKQRNFRLAIRYYYLQTLKFLSEKELISWEQQKTNNDYIQEIQKATLKSKFKELTFIYDYIWYGEFAIDEIKFEALRLNFETINKTIKGNE